MATELLHLGSILVVDDDARVRTELAGILVGLGYEVEEAGDGAAAIPQIKQKHFDLVITDLDMPEVDGMDLLETIKGAQIDTDVLLISGAGSIALAVLAVKLGAANFLEKPVAPEQLKAEVRKIFRSRKGRAAASDEIAVQPRRTITPTEELRPPAARTGSSAMIGRYIVTRTLGVGGMATVYECFDPVLQRVVAVKTIDEAQARDGGDRALVLERFKREAHSNAKLTHPNIVAVYDFGADPARDAMYLAMEYVDGQSLRQILTRTGRLSFERTIKIGFQVADGLEFAHRHGIVHRDIKPPNVLVCAGDVAKILDFGVAKVHNSDLTDSNVVVGSIAYMAPEVLRGHEIDFRADQFALGHVLFEMLTGHILFRGKDFAEVAKNVLNFEAPSLIRMGVGVPDRFQRIMERLLAKQPDKRFSDEMELLGELNLTGRESGVWLELAVPRSRPSSG